MPIKTVNGLKINYQGNEYGVIATMYNADSYKVEYSNRYRRMYMFDIRCESEIYSISRELPPVERSILYATRQKDNDIS